MQKRLLLLSCSVIALSSCSSSGINIGIGGGLGGGGHSGVAIGTSVSVPITGNKNSTKPKLNSQIITYFASDLHDNQAGDEPFEQGYFRVLIDKKGSNKWVIQDFYQQNKARRNDPILIHAKDAYLFNVRPLDGGVYTLYDIDGKIINK